MQKDVSVSPSVHNSSDGDSVAAEARGLTSFLRTEIIQFVRRAQLIHRAYGLDIKRAIRSKSVARILIIIPRLVGSAVERNKVRRRLRSIFYQERLFDKPFDLLVYVKKDAVFADFDQLKTALVFAAHADQ